MIVLDDGAGAHLDRLPRQSNLVRYLAEVLDGSVCGFTSELRGPAVRVIWLFGLIFGGMIGRSGLTAEYGGHLKMIEVIRPTLRQRESKSAQIQRNREG